METGKLTPKSNDTMQKMRFTGHFGQPDGFGSVLEARVNRHGYAYLSLTYKSSGEERVWSMELDNEQRRALGQMMLKFEPTLYEIIS